MVQEKVCIDIKTIPCQGLQDELLEIARQKSGKRPEQKPLPTIYIEPVAEGVVEIPTARKNIVSQWKHRKVAKPLTGTKLSFEGVEAFLVSGLMSEKVGKSVIYRKNGVIAFTRPRCPEVVYVKEDRVKSLKELNRVRFNGSTNSLGTGGQDLLWDCLEDMKDDAMGCFRMIYHNTRPYQPKLDYVSDGYREP